MFKSNKSKYFEVWERYLPAIIQTMQNCNTNMHHILINSYEFKLISNMKSYSFNLEYSDGKVSNNIKGSALARDLAAVIEDSKEARQLIAVGHFKLRMDKKFCLWICRLENNNEMILAFS
jgi:hypothetical protein